MSGSSQCTATVSGKDKPAGDSIVSKFGACRSNGEPTNFANVLHTNMKMPRHLFCPVWLCLALTACAASADSLENGFRNPPESAKPQTWWHWMNGNITKAGLTADLEAMKQIGLGGATIVNVDCGIPRGNVPFMSAEWREDFKFAV